MQRDVQILTRSLYTTEKPPLHHTSYFLMSTKSNPLIRSKCSIENSPLSAMVQKKQVGFPFDFRPPPGCRWPVSGVQSQLIAQIDRKTASIEVALVHRLACYARGRELSGVSVSDVYAKSLTRAAPSGDGQPIQTCRHRVYIPLLCRGGESEHSAGATRSPPWHISYTKRYTSRDLPPLYWR